MGKGGHGKGKGGKGGKGKSKERGRPDSRAKLETVFGNATKESVHELKADASRPLSRVGGAFEVGDGRHLLPYPCPREGIDRPLIEIPVRPEWNLELDAEALDAQESNYFQAWLSGIYKSQPMEELNYFEHNLEVWRQVWRTAFERADIVIMVLDSRIPLFHFSQAVFKHITEKLEKDVVLVLNKADMVPPACIELWSDYFRQYCPGIRIVQFHVPKSGSGRVKQLPCVQELLEALKQCSVLRGGKRLPAAPFFEEGERKPEEGERKPEEFITVALQGDPNMGKSSVINAIFGRKVVSSSLTPGHTKHFQTLFLTGGVCFCDSPGIVCPKLGIPKPLQVLFGSFRIAQVREPYHIVRFLAERCQPALPSLLKIAAFRDRDAEKSEPWSPIGICEAYAMKRGFRKKGGRSDPYRAANLLLRNALNGFEGLSLCFAPPGATSSSVRAAATAMRPDWLVARSASDDEGQASQEEDEDEDEDEEDEEEPSEEGKGEEDVPVPKVRNAFAALDTESESEDN
eukprot:TRINITY_DN11284_c0_g1_i1.p1 TRINITY_DN11284_c0_g1~~TRINITY_DN11284_c0_g1_i1.p1  ORF type:complete len:516 (+),score=126.99 TRINITY_DN11284_c0_g1_i1:67-1614(+)